MSKPWEESALIEAVRARCLASKDITAERFDGNSARVLLSQGWAGIVYLHSSLGERTNIGRWDTEDDFQAMSSGCFYGVLAEDYAAPQSVMDLRGKLGPLKKAADFLTRAAELVGADRETSHGPKKRNHDNIAALWQAYLEIRFDRDAPLTGLDVAHMMALLKVARTQLGNFNPDDYVDMAGYAGCAGEIRTAHIPEKQ